jgi:hypothetical protein
MVGMTDVANAIFRFKKDWIYNKEGDKITDEDKEHWFFIFNRYFSKIYPDKAFYLNQKGIDKATAMDIWFAFMKNQPYPENFWSKSPKIEKDISEKDYKSLQKHLGIKNIDLDYIIEKYPEFIKEELNYLKKLDKNNQ